jgi:hypothetical protein
MTNYPNQIDDNTALPPASGDDATAVNANISATKAVEVELGLAPSGVYADVRTRLDILETRINNPLVPAPNVLNPFYISGTGVTIQTGIHDPSTLALPPPSPGSLFLRQDGYSPEGIYIYRPDGYWHQMNLIGINRRVGSIVTFATSPYNIQQNDDFIPVDSTSGNVTANLPAIPVVGKGYTIADISGAAPAHNITVSGNGKNIIGAASNTISLAYQQLTVVFNGFNWTITGKYP